MNYVAIWIILGIIILLIFPINISSYIYIDQRRKYSSLNVCAFKFIRFFNLNTVEDNPFKMEINGKSSDIDLNKLKTNIFGIISRIPVKKVIQLGDYGILSDTSAYLALIQSRLSEIVYRISCTKKSVKLKNYTVLNQSEKGVRYYAKIVSVVNLIIIFNVIIYLLMEKLNERKS